MTRRVPRPDRRGRSGTRARRGGAARPRGRPAGGGGHLRAVRARHRVRRRGAHARAQFRAPRARRGHRRPGVSAGRAGRAPAGPRASARRCRRVLRAGRAPGRRGGGRDRSPRSASWSCTGFCTCSATITRATRGRCSRGRTSSARCCRCCDAHVTARHSLVTHLAPSVALCSSFPALRRPFRSAAACGPRVRPGSCGRKGRWPPSIWPMAARSSCIWSEGTGCPSPGTARRDRGARAGCTAAGARRLARPPPRLGRRRLGLALAFAAALGAAVVGLATGFTPAPSPAAARATARPRAAPAPGVAAHRGGRALAPATRHRLRRSPAPAPPTAPAVPATAPVAPPRHRRGRRPRRLRCRSFRPCPPCDARGRMRDWPG